jgi:hypothetical protein
MIADVWFLNEFPITGSAMLNRTKRLFFKAASFYLDFQKLFITFINRVVSLSFAGN